MLRKVIDTGEGEKRENSKAKVDVPGTFLPFRYKI